MERRELLRVLGNVGLLSLVAGCGELLPNASGGPGLKQAVQAGTLDQLAQNGKFLLVNVATDTSTNYPVVVAAVSSSTAPAGALAHPTVPGLYLVSFSRVCTHQGTTIDSPASGLMHCPNHGQDYDLKTGNPTGTAGKTNIPLA
ncbi:MAG: Rieske 2Fe-2S domain-containing protein, partial [Thermaceae bacterium]|nr:Rieske 2Fe-2S domain-containing protein [Thermaceae bacterium]